MQFLSKMAKRALFICLALFGLSSLVLAQSAGSLNIPLNYPSLSPRAMCFP